MSEVVESHLVILLHNFPFWCMFRNVSKSKTYMNLHFCFELSLLYELLPSFCKLYLSWSLSSPQNIFTASRRSLWSTETMLYFHSPTLACTWHELSQGTKMRAASSHSFNLMALCAYVGWSHNVPTIFFEIEGEHLQTWLGSPLVNSGTGILDSRCPAPREDPTRYSRAHRRMLTLQLVFFCFLENSLSLSRMMECLVSLQVYL